MLEIKKVEDDKEKNEIFRYRYQIFVERDKDAPKRLYPDGLLKDSCDEDAIHVGCYETADNSLLGFLTVVIKKNLEFILPIERQHNICVEPNSAEIMRLIISDKVDLKLRALVLNGLLQEVGNIVQENNLKRLYLVTTESAKKIYSKVGFKQIGPYKLYMGISNECPMCLDVNEVNRKLV